MLPYYLVSLLFFIVWKSDITLKSHYIKNIFTFTKNFLFEISKIKIFPLYVLFATNINVKDIQFRSNFYRVDKLLLCFFTLKIKSFSHWMEQKIPLIDTLTTIWLVLSSVIVTLLDICCYFVFFFLVVCKIFILAYLTF